MDLAYNLNTKAFFPPNAETSTGDSTPATSTLILSADPDLTLNSKVEPKLIPEVKLGLEAFGLVKADVFLDVEGSLTAKLTLDGSGSVDDDDSASGKIKGCVDIGAAVSVNVGAQGSISMLGLSDSTSDVLYSDKWQLYKQCETAKGSTKREVAPAFSGIARRADITCPSSSTITSIEKIIDEIIKDTQSSSS